MTARAAVLDSPLGPVTLLADGDLLTGVWLPGERRAPAEAVRGAMVGPKEVADDPVLASAHRQLGEYFAGRRREFDLPYELPPGTRGRVLELVRGIPYGQTASYGQLARALNDPSITAQSFAWRMLTNPFTILVPCHRVVGADGSLTGYQGGLAAKRWLLAREEPAAAAAGRLF